MDCRIPLTPEQSMFANNHHDVVHSFLQKRRLPEDEYYDIVIFGYLRAVRRFFMEERLQYYEFVTIAWQCMQTELANYLKAQKRKKRTAETVSLHVGLFDEDPPLEETIIAPDDLLHRIDADLLLHDLSRQVSGQQMDIVRMRAGGYTLQDIASRQNLSVKRIRRLLDEVHSILTEMCSE